MGLKLLTAIMLLIQKQQEQLKQQQSVIEGLRKLVYRNNSQAEVCQ